ncbi:MAG: hypothetical protein K2M55_02145 [Muribaculaceae bacterium]|nr:hypothetical protein [Muribaculaceae bacterium]
MKMILPAVAGLFCMAAVVACSDKKEESASGCQPYTVDSLLNNADALVGDTVCVEGVVNHLCSHGATKAFLVGADSALLRCQATAEMGGAFPLDCKGTELCVYGVVREQRTDSAAVEAMEARYAAADSAAQAHEGCDTEKKAAGQDSCSTFAARMEDYRARIAERCAKEGKNYLSTYYVEALKCAPAGECCTKACDKACDKECTK